MRPSMHGQVTAIRKHHAALLALEGLLSCMRPSMHGQLIACSTRLHSSHLKGFSPVCVLICCEASALSKRFSTLIAREGLLSRVHPSMRGQSPAMGKHCVANLDALKFRGLALIFKLLWWSSKSLLSLSCRQIFSRPTRLPFCFFASAFSDKSKYNKHEHA